jgi:glycosyltransferase involved in cell wall biosynthesis
MPRLSVIVITKDEAPRIGRCLDSVAWADERIVLDSGSSDDTVAIARARGARVEVATDWPGFGAQKNRALALATGDWVLSLDADEWLSEGQRVELERAVATAAGPAAYRMPRRSTFLGRPMRHSGWWPDHVTRLFRRGAARFSDDPVHERLLVEGEVGTLRAPILHEPYRELDEVVAKMNRYSTAGAERMAAEGRGASVAGAALRGLWSFVRVYLLRRGFLDGREGFVLAVASAEGTYYRYLKLAYRRRTGA